MSNANKTYGQLCPIARSLDLLGDRWTLLVVREFLLGPKRFKELLAVLPAMGTNRLSQRLKVLQEDGVIEQSESVAPAYQLTPMGEQLRNPLVALGLWGLNLPIDERIDASSARAELIALCLAGASDPAASAGVSDVYEFEVGEETFHLKVDDGSILPRSGASPMPVGLRVRLDLPTFLDIALGRLTPEQSLAEERVTVLQGDNDLFLKAFFILRYRR